VRLLQSLLTDAQWQELVVRGQVVEIGRRSGITYYFRPSHSPQWEANFQVDCPPHDRTCIQQYQSLHFAGSLCIHGMFINPGVPVENAPYHYMAIDTLITLLLALRTDETHFVTTANGIGGHLIWPVFAYLTNGRIEDQYLKGCGIPNCGSCYSRQPLPQGNLVPTQPWPS
jgi:hypothetical protein